MTTPKTGSDIIVGGRIGTGYVLSSVVPPRRTLLVSCNVVAISTKSILSVGKSCRLVLSKFKIIRSFSGRPASIRLVLVVNHRMHRQ